MLSSISIIPTQLTLLRQNTVRHVLSTSQQFEKSRRPITEPGKGGYWSVSKTLPKSDSNRTRRVNRVVSRKEKEVVTSDPPSHLQPLQSPPIQTVAQPPHPAQSWAPQQISVPVSLLHLPYLLAPTRDIVAAISRLFIHEINTPAAPRK